MTNRASAFFFFVALGVPVEAQWLKYPTPGVPSLPDGRPNLSAPAPRSPDGKPDLSGLWEADMQGATPSANGTGATLLPPEFVNVAARLKGGLPYRPWARELRDARQANNQEDSPDSKCLPLGVVWLHSNMLPRKILQVPGFLVTLYEKNTLYRQIFTDGRPLPADPQPSFLGYSSGKWEGDTLVVQTIGFRDGLWADFSGNPLTDAAKVTERYRRPNYGNLEIEVVVDDPKAYTAPWTVTLHQQIKLDTDLLEYVCLENEKSASRRVKK